MKTLITLISFALVCLSCQAQTDQSRELVGGPCEGCEAVFEYGDERLAPVDTLIDFHEPGPKLKVTGTVYENDGQTPAEDVVLYIYHTNQEGIYPTRGDEKGWARRHGYIRGWVKTDSTGEYAFYTLKPGTYPSRSAPAHIHITVLEPDGKYYWLHSYLFANDPLLSKSDRETNSGRGGGKRILDLNEKNGILVGTRDIILGKNIPGYE
ncbi:intradiol ring-cleavage dioxygenase [candidate division KSB1 bacterium]|nr:intradiol ring-cleavage dioxygenase [candidate division KSB1 bacterium]